MAKLVELRKLSKDSYLGEETDINDKEYLELQEKVFFIINKFKKYVNGYISFKKNGGNNSGGNGGDSSHKHHLEFEHDFELHWAECSECGHKYINWDEDNDWLQLDSSK